MKAQSFSATPTQAEAIIAHGIDNGQDHQKGNADQQILEGNGRSQSQDLSHQPSLKPQVLFSNGKGQGPPPDHCQGQKDAGRLGCHCGQGCSGCPHVKAGHQEKVSSDVKDAGGGHGK